MKFRKNFTHEFCVRNALGLGTTCLHKVTYFGFVRFLSENSFHSKFFYGRSQPAVRIFCCFSRSQRLKSYFSRSNEISPD